MSKPPYENVYIGSFIYALGYLSGKKNSRSGDASAHLIQQTPDDKKWGDLVNRWQGRYFLLEFKREAEGCLQERKKKYCKKGKCNKHCKIHFSTYFTAISDSNNTELKTIADKAHFIGFGTRLINGRTIRFFPYSDIPDDVQSLSEIETVPLNDFCNNIVDGKLGVDHISFSEYLSFLANCVKENATGSTGFIVNIDNKGNVNLVDVNDINGIAIDFEANDLEAPEISLHNRQHSSSEPTF
jgi:hypothetical protein